MKTQLLAAAIALAIATPAFAQTTPADPTAPSTPSADEVTALEATIVTGTRRSDRTVAESLAPIDVLTPTELQNAGTPELQAVLARIVPSFNFPRTSITDGSDHVRPAQLRGLAPDQTLVLINGKRRHRTAIINVNGTVGRGSSPVDLNAIPIGAIERVEVLRDGAAAQYGSDAIAGVINIVLKNAPAGGEAQYRYGIHDKGDGRLNQVWANAGFGNEDGAFLNFTAEWRDKGFTNRSEPDLRQQFALVNGQRDVREGTIDRLNHRFGDASTADQQFIVNTGLPIGDSELYAFANVSHRDGESAGFYRRAVDPRNVLAVWPNGFLPLIVTDVRDRSLVTGWRGLHGSGWSYDVSWNYGESAFDFNVENSVNNSIGATSQRNFFAGTLRSSQSALNVDLANSYDVGFLVSPLSTALGLEYRKETFSIREGEPASFFGTGSQVFPGFRPSDAGKRSRNNWSFYADLEGDVTDQLTVGLATRYEDYSDFGNELTGKLSGRFAITDALALRGSVSTGFRAPNLQQQFYATTATNFINVGGGLQPFDVRTFAVSDPVAIALGAEPLRAETSQNVSAGIVWSVFDALNLTLDWYQIKIDDRIILSENLTGPAVRAFLAARGFPATDGGRYFTNAVDTTTRGFDFVSRYTHDFGDFGETTATLGYNRNKTTVDRIAANPPALTTGGLNLQRIGRVEIGRITVGPPKDKLVLGVDHALGPFSGSLTATRYGRWALLNINPVLDESFAAQWVADLALTYRYGAASFTIGAENLNNAFPPRLRRDIGVDANGFAVGGPLDNSFVGILPYARGEAPFGFNGRFYYASVALTW